MSTLARLFNQDRLDSLDPNKPENQPLLKAEQSLKNQAFVRWYEEVGHYLIDGLEKSLIVDIVKAIGDPRVTDDDRMANLRLLDRIQQNLNFVDHIVGAYEEEEKRKK